MSVPAKIKPKTEKTIRVGVIYNLFDPTDIKWDKIVWRKNTTLKTYLRGLPVECEWKIGVNGIPVDQVEDAKLRLKPNDTISLVIIPKGGTLKTILRTIAFVVVGFILGGPIGAGIALAASFIVGIAISLLTGNKQNTKDEPDTYGYDGAKNTVKEGVALPVVYGKFRAAGNYVDLFTANEGDDQYLYGRTVLSDGKIHAVTLAEINQNPIDNYKNVTWGYTLGSDTENLNSYFGRTISQIAVGTKFVSGSYINYTTSIPVDRIQLNMTMPMGLVKIDKKDGSKSSRDIDLECEYKLHSSGTWLPMPKTEWISISTSGTTPSTKRLRVDIRPNITDTTLPNQPYAYTLQYKLSTDVTWTNWASQSGLSEAYSQFYDSTHGDFITGLVEAATTIDGNPNQRTFELSVPAGTYQVRVLTGGTATILDFSYEKTSAATNGAFTITAKTLKAIRRSIESPSLTLGIYDIRIKKTSADGDERHIDTIYLTDVGEIVTEGITHATVATAWYRIKVNDQINNVPDATFLVEGVECNQYDVNGTVTSKVWTDNPAWIVLDMLIGDERGEVSTYAIDFPAFLDWADYCEASGYKFNGMFDTTTTLWDAAQDVLKVGHAYFSRIGTKLSVAIDRSTTPVMLFGPGNIFKDSFKITYLPMADRANDYELTYYDKDDRNKAKVIRIVDPVAEANSEPSRPVSFDMKGIDNFTQAQNEIWYQIYSNRYLRRTLQFDAPIEAVGLSIGDVALVQHDVVNWGVSGRVGTSASATVITLDRNIVMDDPGTDYGLLIIHNFLITATGLVKTADAPTKTYTLKNLTNGTFSTANAKRLKNALGEDVEIVSVTQLGSDMTDGIKATIITATALTSTTGTMTIYDTDVIEERDVTYSAGTHQTVTVTSAFSQTPGLYSNFMFGDKEIIKKPYRLREVQGTDLDRRTLTFLEYNETIYGDPAFDVPQPASVPSPFPTHVNSLTFTFEARSTSTNNTLNGVVTWRADSIYKYGGADIYVARNGDEFIFEKTVLNVTECSLALDKDQPFLIKVVAFNREGIRALTNTAPYIDQSNLVTGAIQFDVPTSVTVTLVTFLSLGIVDVAWGYPTDYSVDDEVKFRVQIKRDGMSTWDEYGITSELFIRAGDLPEGDHTARVRMERATSFSPWVEEDFTLSPGADYIHPGADVTADNVVGLYHRDLVINDGAELGDTTAWGLVEHAGTGTETFTASSADKNTGTYSFLIHKSATTRGAGYGTSGYPVTPGKKYYFEVTLKGSSATGTGLYLRVNYKTTTPGLNTVIDAGIRDNYTDLIANGAIPNIWTTYSYTWTCPSNTYWASPTMYNYTSGPVDMYFDDVTFSSTEPAADVTSNAVPILNKPLDLLIEQDSTGTALAGQYNVILTFSRQRGSYDVTATTDWSIVARTGTLTSGNCTINNTPGDPDIGKVTITGGVGKVTVSSTRGQEAVLLGTVELKAHINAPPADQSTVNSFTTVTSTSDNVVTTVMSRAASGTSIVCSANITFRCGSPGANGDSNIKGKWQYSTTGVGSWSDVGSFVTGSAETSFNPGDPFKGGGSPGGDGSLTVSQTKTGLTATTVYYFRLVCQSTGAPSPGYPINLFGTGSLT